MSNAVPPPSPKGSGAAGGFAGSTGMVVVVAAAGAVLAVLASVGIVTALNQTPSSENDSSVVNYGTTTQ